jgi:hypothetical protein
MKAPARNQRRVLIGSLSLGAVALAAVLVAAIVGCDSGDGPRRDLTTPSQEREAEGRTSTGKPTVTVRPVVTQAPPTHIEIRGQQVPLAPGMTYGRRGGGPGEGIPEPGVTTPPTPSYREVWQVDYDSNPAAPGYSWLSFDENYSLLTNAVRPEDQEEFQPILDALAGAGGGA